MGIQGMGEEDIQGNAGYLGKIIILTLIWGLLTGYKRIRGVGSGFYLVCGLGCSKGEWALVFSWA